MNGQDILLGATREVPITGKLDTGVSVGTDNLIKGMSNGTFGSFPYGTPIATQPNPREPYPEMKTAFKIAPTGKSFPDDGYYQIQNILNTPPDWTQWRMSDHTSRNETGEFMLINGDMSGKNILEQTVTVPPTEDLYLFSVWAVNMCKKLNYADPAFGIKVTDGSGKVLYDSNFGTTVNWKNADIAVWNEVGTAIKNPAGNTTLKIELVSKGPAATGNDYAIDDISLKKLTIPAPFPVTKTASPDPAKIGEIVTYTVELKYDGKYSLTNVNFKDTLPPGMTYVANSVKINGTANSGDPTSAAGVTVPNIGPNSKVTITFQARATSIPAVNPTPNKATMSYDYTPIEGGVPSLFTSDSNTSTVRIIEDASDLAIEKTTQNTTAAPGDVITYTLKVTNLGPATAKAPLISDTMPAALTNQQVSVDNGATWQSWSGSRTLADLAENASASILLRGTVSNNATGTITNTATVSRQYDTQQYVKHVDDDSTPRGY